MDNRVGIDCGSDGGVGEAANWDNCNGTTIKKKQEDNLSIKGH